MSFRKISDIEIFLKVSDVWNKVQNLLEWNVKSISAERVDKQH